MTMELYNASQSTCSQKVRLVMHEKDIKFVDHRMKLFHGDQLKPEYLKINPNGVVPALRHDTQTIIESSVIVEYLDELTEQDKLSPDTTPGRADMRVWMRFIDEVPTPAVRYPSYNQAFIKHYRDMDEAEFDKLAAAKPLRKHFFKKFARTGFSQELLDEANERIRLTATRMEQALRQGPWLVGKQLTLADFCMLPLIDRAADLGLAHIWADCPAVKDWLVRLQARLSYTKTFYYGAKLSDQYESIGGKPRTAPPESSTAT